MMTHTHIRRSRLHAQANGTYPPAEVSANANGGRPAVEEARMLPATLCGGSGWRTAHAPACVRVVAPP